MAVDTAWNEAAQYYFQFCLNDDCKDVLAGVESLTSLNALVDLGIKTDNCLTSHCQGKKDGPSNFNQTFQLHPHQRLSASTLIMANQHGDPGVHGEEK